MARKNDYGLPDETLQLIAAAPSLFAGGKYLQQRTNLSSRQAPSEWIAALRGSGTDNPGFTQYANRANADSASARTARRGLFAPSRLTMGRVTRDVTLPGAETTVPTTRIPRIVTDPLVPDVPVTPAATPTDPVTPLRRTGIESINPDPVNPATIPLIPAPDILETVPSIYTKPIATDIPDDPVDPSTIPWIIPEFPLELPEIPEVPDKIGVVEINSGDTPIPDVVGPRKGGGGDLPEDFDKYLVEILNSLSNGGGAVGGGKPANDTYGSILEM